MFTNLGSWWDMNSKNLTRSRSLYWFLANVCSKVENKKIHHLAAFIRVQQWINPCLERKQRREHWYSANSQCCWIQIFLLCMLSFSVIKQCVVILHHVKNPADHWWHIVVDVGNIGDLVHFHFSLEPVEFKHFQKVSFLSGEACLGQIQNIGRCVDGWHW